MKNVGAKMRELRIGKRYSQQHVADIVAKVEPRADVPLISRYENGVCLATPAQARAMCELYECGLADLYDVEDLDFGRNRLKRASAERGEGLPYKLTARLENELASRFFWALGVLGVSDKTEWVKKYVRLTIKAAERRQKKAAACAGTQTTTRKK